MQKATKTKGGYGGGGGCPLLAPPYLEGPLTHTKVLRTQKKMLRTVFGIRAFFFLLKCNSHFLRLPFAALAKCSRENKPATRAQSPASRAQFAATRAQFQNVCKAKAVPRNPCVCIVVAFSITRALICHESSSKNLYQWPPSPHSPPPVHEHDSNTQTAD